MTDWFRIEHYVDRSRGLLGTDVLFGTGRIAELGEIFERRAWRTALLVCGRSVSNHQHLIERVTSATGIEVQTFAGVTTGKSLASVYAGIDVMRRVGADVIIGLGSGSAIDVARQMSAFGADRRSRQEFERDAAQGRLRAPEAPRPELPVVLVPTTLPGGAISATGSIEVLAADQSPTGQPIRTNGHVTPEVILHDPELVAMTPASVLCASAMNGINKAVEAVYGRSADTLSDAYATEALRLVRGHVGGLPARTPADVAGVTAGLVLAQLRRSSSILHAFGHAVARRSSVQQGVAHAVVTPHALAWLFRQSDARRRVTAHALGISTRDAGDEQLADEIIRSITGIRDALGLPSRWADCEGADGLDLDATARCVCQEPLMRNAPLVRPIEPDEAHAILAAAL